MAPVAEDAREEAAPAAEEAAPAAEDETIIAEEEAPAATLEAEAAAPEGGNRNQLRRKLAGRAVGSRSLEDAPATPDEASDMAEEAMEEAPLIAEEAPDMAPDMAEEAPAARRSGQISLLIRRDILRGLNTYR